MPGCIICYMMTLSNTKIPYLLRPKDSTVSEKQGINQCLKPKAAYLLSNSACFFGKPTNSSDMKN